MRHPADELATEVGGPCLYTFTAPLPFPIGVPDGSEHAFSLGEAYADPEDQDFFGDQVFVKIRVFSSKVPGLPMWPPGMHEALKELYDHDFVDEPATRYGEDSLNVHHQWVTLETPCAPSLKELDEVDPAFAFHRCLSALNIFLRGIQAATADITIRPVASHDLRPVVVIGALTRDGGWKFLNCMLMHPEARPEGLPPERESITGEQLETGVAAVLAQQPYLTTMSWRCRAQRAFMQEGDAADAIISFQIAAESLLFETYRMLLIDEGLTSGEVLDELEKERSFKSLVTRTMPSKLGGRWDVGAADTPVNEYWNKLYRVRNAIVHSGVEPHGLEAEQAQDGYRCLRDHLEERLKAKRTTYPRTVYARLGEAGLKTDGRLSRKMRHFLEKIKEEPGPWYWPHDVAERSPSGGADG